MEPQTFELTSSAEHTTQNEIRIEIQDANHEVSSHGHNTIHTIRLQSPGGSSHFVEGLVVTTNSQQTPTSHHMTLAHGNTIIVDNDEVVLHNENMTLGEATGEDGEQIICGPGIQMVLDENGETILLVPKQDSSAPVVVLNAEEVQSIENSYPIKQISLPSISEVETSRAVSKVQSRETPTLFMVSESGDTNLDHFDGNYDIKSNLTNVEADEGGRPKRKAALKAIEARKSAKRKRTVKIPSSVSTPNAPTDNLEQVNNAVIESTHLPAAATPTMEFVLGDDQEDKNKPTVSCEKTETTLMYHKVKGQHGYASSSEDEEIPIRRCVVCLRQKRFTEDIFDSSKQLLYHIDVLIAHLNVQIKGTPANTGLCPDCMNHLQRWHVFNCAIAKRHEHARIIGSRVIDERLDLQPFETKVYKNYKKMARVQEVYSAATHGHYGRRHLNEKDWDFFCDHLFNSNSVKSEKSKELEKFLTSREKLSKLYCITCEKMIPNGKKGYAKHMQTEHQQTPVLYPCDICGSTFPERDMTASTEDYYPHWISHFYFNKCEDCNKRFPTKRALGQHRHAVHKNRQVKCDKCGKVLANKMSLDLHLLRHLPENEKKKYMIKCKICKKKIAQWNLKSHLATHNDERPWKCDHCDATFKMKGALVSHRDVVHFNLKNHACSICGDAFKSASSLRGHVRRHEGRKDYKCEVCLKEYYTYSALKGHKVVHQTVRNFICPTCDKAFKKKKALDEHVTIHTGEKPHRCPICGREIRVKSNLYKHMKIHKKSQVDATGQTTTTTIIRKSPTSPDDDQSVLSSTLITGNSSNWPPNGTMMVTLDNGTVVSDVTPLVVSLQFDGLHSSGSVLELNSEQHAQLINAVAVQSSGNSSQETTYLTSHYFPSTGSQGTLVQEASIDCGDEEFTPSVKKRGKILFC